ncbi:MAG: oxidoreductase C-terminal domain-containing protein, partial [Pannonibacter indicus]
VAKNMAKQEASVYGALPWFWSDQGGWKLQIAGLSLPGDDEVLIERDGRPLSVFRFRSGRFVALETVNGPAEHMAARKILQTPVSLSRKDLEERDFDLKGLVQTLAKEG